MQTLQMNTHELMHKDAPARFAAWLVQRIELTDAAGLRGVVRLTERKRDIASQLAITPETLSRLMRSLTRQGVISVAGYNVQVLDAPALRQIAAGA
ncbi:MAG: helix-turn-helix domain-containing protein [Comamonadaceae bacterium]|nr:helix-turn-helix domain-containing protein [Comamonadaceae bacterium]